MCILIKNHNHIITVTVPRVLSYHDVIKISNNIFYHDCLSNVFDIVSDIAEIKYTLHPNDYPCIKH